uniref:Uncharacterized protein n=1 Tax=Rhizophora mucronata TaxID=61149 RepID=A0A2P2NCW4_RHIMU
MLYWIQFDPAFPNIHQGRFIFRTYTSVSMIKGRVLK